MLAMLLTTASLAAIFPFAWAPNGVQVAGGEVYVARGASDGSGGALVTWLDENRDFGNQRDVAGQRLLPTGIPAPGWPEGGRTFAVTDSSEGPEGAAAGMSGDAFWLLYRSYNDVDLYLSHTLASGTLDPTWPARGLGIAVGRLIPRFPLITPDGTGGVFISWNNDRNYFTVDTVRDARLLRVSPSGALSPGWPAGGLLIAAANPGAVISQIVPDGAGGCFAVWMHNQAGVGILGRAVRITADGALSPGWPAAGVRICDLVSEQYLAEDVCAIPDGSGGIYVAWDDNREAPTSTGTGATTDIYMTRLRSDGTRAPGWPADGLPLYQGPGTQWFARMCTDGVGGAIVAWTNQRTGKPWISRVTPTGALAPGWQAGGNALSSASGTAENVRLASDGAGGAYAGWVRSTPDDFAWAQHILADGTVAPGWTLAGAALVDLSVFHGEGWVSIFPSLPGSAIVTWSGYSDPNNYAASIRAQRLVSEGLVPTQLALHSVQADASGVRLEWWGVGATAQRYVVERSIDGLAWEALGDAVSTSGEQLTYEDRDVLAGQRLAYRLVGGDARLVVSATWVEVPHALRFALTGARPNPVRTGALTVELTLAKQAPGTLEVLDLAGRRLAWRELSSLAPGRHTLPFPESAQLAPGMHWLRLRQGEQVATARVVLTR